MRTYHERLRLPASWWVLGMITAVLVASVTWTSFLGVPAIAGYVLVGSYLLIVGGPAAAFLAMGATTIEVADGELRVGRKRLPLDQAVEVTAVDADQSRALRGPRCDPAAVLLFRPYLQAGVFVRLSGPPGSPPYWLVGSRRPAELAAAIEAARPGRAPVPPPARPPDAAARPGDPAVG